jgi:hypothetical protein
MQELLARCGTIERLLRPIAAGEERGDEKRTPEHRNSLFGRSAERGATRRVASVAQGSVVQLLIPHPTGLGRPGPYLLRQSAKTIDLL